MCERKWSRDWAGIDWEQIKEKLDMYCENPSEQVDIGLTKEDLNEYMEWLGENDLEEYLKVKLLVTLFNSAFSEDGEIGELKFPASIDELIEEK